MAELEYASPDAYSHYETGLGLLLEKLGRDHPRYAEALTYQQRLLENISQGLERARQQSEHFSLTHENVIANLADTYLNTVSTINPRIMVNGDPHLLQRPDVANRIRALLLAGIRSAVLWRQSGGGRLQLLFKRRAILNEAGSLLRMH